MNTSSSLQPLISILITYYNNGPFIREAVESARAQTYSKIEVVIIDDGSPDPGAPHLIGIENIQIIWQQNRGCSAARNAGARHAQGEYLIFLDGDDRLLPTAIETQLAALQTEPDAGFTFGAVQRINQQGKLIRGVHICRPRRDYFGMLLESKPTRPNAYQF